MGGEERKAPLRLLRSHLPLASGFGGRRWSWLVAEEVFWGEHALGLEVFEGFFGGFEDFGGRLGDEGGGVFGGFPDDIDLFGVFPGVLEFAFYAAA